MGSKKSQDTESSDHSSDEMLSPSNLRGQKSFLKILLFSLLIISTSSFSISALAQNKKMTFYGIPPDPQLQFMTGNAWVIFADGEITDKTPKDFEEYLQSNRVSQRSHLYINSLGGNALGGVELGRLIRKWNLATSVGAYGSGENLKNYKTRYSVAPGVCFSACATAFLGGLFRYDTSTTKSSFGIHRFSFLGETNHAAELAQMLSAIQTKYIRDMGVEPEFFERKSTIPSSDLEILSPGEMVRLKIANNGRTKVDWSFNEVKNILYLKGERDTAFGINKVMFICVQKVFYLHIIFDPIGREDEVLSNPLEHISLDGRLIDFRKKRVQEKAVENGWINVIYRLTGNDLQLIERSKTLGFLSRLSEHAPVFLGFEDFELIEGLSKLKAFKSACS